MRSLREYSGLLITIGVVVAFIIVLFGGGWWLLMLGAFWAGWGPEVVDSWRWHRFRAQLSKPGDDWI